MSVESHDLGPVPNLTALSGYGDSYVVPGDEVYVVSEDTDYIYLNSGSNPPADGFNIIKAIFLPGVWQRRSSGGGAGALRFNTVAVGAAGSGRLIDTSLAGLVDGTSLAWVESVKDTWRWDATSVLTADNITVCNPTANGANPGRFIRELIAAPEWMFQTTWVVDEANSSGTANDENTGLTAVTALLTDTERRRRMGSSCIWQTGTAYHLRYISTATAVIIEGFFSANSSCYIHASMNDREGVTPPLYSGTVDAIDLLNTAPVAAAVPYAITSNGLAVNWAGLIDKRGRVTSGANAGAIFWPTLQDGVTPKKARTTEILTPVASFTAAPFAAPATAQAPPAVNDTFVIEDLRTITRCEIMAATMPGNITTGTRVIFDSVIVTTLILSDNCGVYLDGCQPTTSFRRGAFTTYHACKILGLNEDGLKSIIGGYSTSASLLLFNNLGSNVGISNFTIQGDRSLIFNGAGNQASPDTWRPNQIGIFDCTAPVFFVFGQGWRLSSNANLYGSGNTTTNGLIGLSQNAITIGQQAIYGQPVLAGGSVFFKLTIGGRTTCPAFDQTTGLFTAPRTLSQTNLGATVAAGGFDYSFMDPVSGAGAVKY